MKLAKATSRIARSGRALFLPAWFSSSLLYRFSVLVVFTVCLFVPTVQAAGQIELLSDSETATAGYYQLQWRWPNATEETTFVLEETSIVNGEAHTRQVYTGSDLASVISGKPDGIYEYSIRVLDAQQRPLAQSETVRVEVAHHPLNRALLFFLLGLIVFVAILIVILRGDTRTRQE